MPSVRSGDALVAYERSGSGPPLMLVHGTGSDARTTWSTVAGALAGERTLVLPDLRGSGATTDGGGRLALEQLASDLVAVADGAGLGRFDIAGFSLGGAIAAAVAAAAGERVCSLALIAAAPSGLDSRARLQFELWRDLHERDAGLLARLWLLTGLSPRFVRSIPAGELARAAAFRFAPGLARQATLAAEIDLTPLLGAIRAPTLVIGCGRDAVTPADDARALADAIAGARYVELDCGHLAMLEAPTALADELLEFLRQTQAGR